MNTDPITLAREVLDLAHEDETVTVCSVPDNKAAALDRAVLAVAEIARTSERMAADEPYAGATFGAHAACIRAALNGGRK